jgi:hypothetical protein
VGKYFGNFGLPDRAGDVELEEVMTNRKDLFWLGLIVLLSTMLSFAMLSQGHGWGDDFAGYLSQAKSITTWTMRNYVRENEFTISQSSYPIGPYAYPWGYPLLLAPAYSLAGLQPLYLKLVSVICYSGFLVILFLLARMHLASLDSLIVTCVFAFNPVLLGFQNEISADIPFLCFSMLSMFLIDKLTDQMDSNKNAILTGSFIFLSWFIRSNGLLLFAPLALAHILMVYKKIRESGSFSDWKALALPYISFGILFFFQSLFFPNGGGSYSISNIASLIDFTELKDQVAYYFWLPVGFIDFIPWSKIIYLIIFPFIILGAVTRFQKYRSFLVYVLVTLLIYMIWPAIQGLRFMFPVLPFVVLFSISGMHFLVDEFAGAAQKIGTMILRLLWSGFILAALVSSISSAWHKLETDRKIDGPFDANSAQMFAFVRNEIPADEPVVFFKPRAMSLFTGHRSFMANTCKDIMGAGFVAIHKTMGNYDQVPKDDFVDCRYMNGAKVVFSNDTFDIYELEQK